MGNLYSNSFIDSSFFDEIFRIHYSTNINYFTKDSITEKDQENVAFCNGRYQASYFQEKHFLNVYRVYDHIKRKWNNLKIIRIINKEEIKDKIIKESQKFYNLTLKENYVKIENIFINDMTYNKNYTQLIILEEAHNFITLKDFIIIFLEEIRGKKNWNLVKYKIKIGSV